MGFSLMSWNVRHFQAQSQSRIDSIVELIRAGDPDVFGIIEFKRQAKEAARRMISQEFTDYDFAITDSKMQIDFLIGWRRSKFAQALFTQRRDFQEGNINLRPGGLLSVRQRNQTAFHNILFLHTDSGKSPEEYRRRQAMYGKVWGLRAALAGLPIQQGDARLVALGDFNTMGRSRSGSLPTLRAEDEVIQLGQAAAGQQMRLLEKSASLTYRSAGGSLRGNLDHVLVSNDLSVQQWEDPSQEHSPFEVEVSGWNWLEEPARTEFIREISDHCALWAQVL